VSHVLGLPDDITACLFDLDGVLTQTAEVHQAAWKRTFDEFLHGRDPDAAEFTQDDYNRYVDGKPREDGVRDFLASRGITLPEGEDSDAADAATVRGLATRKNELLLRELDEHGVQVYEGSMRYLRAVREAGLATAVVTASANGGQVVAAGGFADLIDARAGDFGFVVGVDRVGQTDELRERGADVVVTDLAQLMEEGR
jgi:beta-phosphoglucomutase-like phosphatase (HAD superfamily)